MSAEPLVSVIVPSWNGRGLLPPCLESLAGQEYPRERLEVLVVDNASTDGTAEWLSLEWPGVRVVRAEENLGFAGGTNAGARAARGELLVFLNNDAAAAPGFVRALVDGALPDAGIAAVAARIVEWTGEGTEFGGSGLSVLGLGYQRSSWHPAFRETAAGGEIPFACGAAMLVRRDVFLALGGFDPAFFAYYEDVDLGWRLWLSGHRVLYAPAAVARHRRRATADRESDRWRHFHWYRNTLQTLVKNSETRFVGRLFPAALATWFSRVGGFYDLAAGARRAGAGDEAERHLACAVGAAEGIAWVLAHMDELLERRRQVQAGRRVGDESLARRFGMTLDLGPDAEHWDENTLALQLLQLVDLSDLLGAGAMEEACEQRLRALRAAGAAAASASGEAAALTARLHRDLDARNREVDRLGRELDARNRATEEEQAGFVEALRVAAAEAEGLHASLDGRNHEVERLQRDLDARNREVERLHAELAARDGALATARADAAQAESARGDLERRLRTVLASRSWRWSAPLRALASRRRPGR
ncbi:MAG: glycosyltransferase [Vicinamibacteria bacterium]